MTHYTLPDLTFDGDLLADESSRQSGNTRWTEVRIYRTYDGEYVTEVVGRSIRDGETDRVKVRKHDSAMHVRRSLTLFNPETHVEYLTKTAEAALRNSGLMR